MRSNFRLRKWILYAGKQWNRMDSGITCPKIHTWQKWPNPKRGNRTSTIRSDTTGNWLNWTKYDGNWAESNCSAANRHDLNQREPRFVRVSFSRIERTTSHSNIILAKKLCQERYLDPFHSITINSPFRNAKQQNVSQTLPAILDLRFPISPLIPLRSFPVAQA